MSSKIPVSFKDTEMEKELLEWVKEKSKILGTSNFIKQILNVNMKKNFSKKWYFFEKNKWEKQVEYQGLEKIRSKSKRST